MKVSLSKIADREKLAEVPQEHKGQMECGMGISMEIMDGVWVRADFKDTIPYDARRDRKGVARELKNFVLSQLKACFEEQVDSIPERRNYAS